MFCLFFFPRGYLHLFLCSFIEIYPIIFYKFQLPSALWPPAFNFCLCCDSLTRNLYLSVVKMINFFFLLYICVCVFDKFLRISFQDPATNIFYNLLSINCTILPLSFRPLMALDTTLACDVM